MIEDVIALAALVRCTACDGKFVEASSATNDKNKRRTYRSRCRRLFAALLSLECPSGSTGGLHWGLPKQAASA
jgi:hypothetical protein